MIVLTKYRDTTQIMVWNRVYFIKTHLDISKKKKKLNSSQIAQRIVFTHMHTCISLALSTQQNKTRKTKTKIKNENEKVRRYLVHVTK